MADGSRVLQMGGGYINGCRVLVAYDFAGVGSNGAGRFDILESTGSRSLYLTWDIRHADTDRSLSLHMQGRDFCFVLSM